MRIEPATYVLNHNISVVLPCFITLSQLLLKQIHNYDGRVTLVRKIQNIECSQNIILSCVYRTLYLVSSGYEKVQLEVRRLQRACSKDRFSCLGQPQSGHAMLTPFFQPRYSTVLNEKTIDLLPFFLRCAASLQCYNHKIRICEFKLHCIEFNVPRTNSSIKQRQSTKHEQGASQLFPEKESRVTATFQGGAFSPFPPGFELLVLFASGFVALLQEGDVCRNSRTFGSFRERRNIFPLA